MAQIFPKWTNKILYVAPPAILGLLTLITFIFWYWFSPLNLSVGYQPRQPIPFSHKLHVGNLGMDCRYCHQFVERGPSATVPSTETCMNCHTNVKKDSYQLKALHESWDNNTPVPWNRVYKVPDYAYFDHSAHVSVGVGCVSCHGRVDQMETVRMETPLSMGWCLTCHRNPAPNLRPLDKITDMEWKPTIDWQPIADARAKLLHPPVESCSGCHR